MKILYRIFITLTILLLLAGLILGNLLKPQSSKQAQVRSNQSQQTDVKDLPRINAFKGDQPLHILILGVDETATNEYTAEEYGSRSDTIMVFSIDPVKKTVQLLSVPRDTYVNIPGYSKTKINHAWSHGGYPLVEKTVEDFLGIKIDYHAIVRYNAVKELTQAAGGVEVYLPVDYKYTDTLVKPALRINFTKGYHMVAGEKAVDFLRIRKAYADQDIGRINQQQKFLMALFQKMKNKSIIFKLPQLIDIANENIESDLSYGQIVDLAYFGLSLDKENIHMATLEGQEKMIDDISYWFVEKESARRQMQLEDQKQENEESQTDQGQNQEGGKSN